MLYSFALAYELISQFKQTSSKAGAFHSMVITPRVRFRTRNVRSIPKLPACCKTLTKNIAAKLLLNFCIA